MWTEAEGIRDQADRVDATGGDLTEAAGAVSSAGAVDFCSAAADAFRQQIAARVEDLLRARAGCDHAADALRAHAAAVAHRLREIPALVGGGP